MGWSRECSFIKWGAHWGEEDEEQAEAHRMGSAEILKVKESLIIEALKETYSV